jgi:hypothetical protein
VILFLETGSLTTLLLHDVYFSSLFFFLGPCIPANHFVFTWDVQTLAIVYMTFVVFMDGFGFLLWLCVSGYVYGCMFMDVRLGMCLGTCMDVCLWMYVWVCVWVRVWTPGLDPPRGLVQ